MFRYEWHRDALTQNLLGLSFLFASIGGALLGSIFWTTSVIKFVGEPTLTPMIAGGLVFLVTLLALFYGFHRLWLIIVITE